MKASDSFPLVPQRIVLDLRKVFEPDDIVVSNVEAANELLPTLRQAIADDTVVLIDCPVDYAENMKLTAKLGNLVCPI